VEIREPGPAEDLDQLIDLGVRAFGPATPAERENWLAGIRETIANHRLLAAFDGTRIAAAARFHDLGQWWLGRSVPTAGVASVMVAPEDRGKGTGRALMAALLDVIAARGYPLSMLYPATMSLYRSQGYELAGRTYEAALPARSLRTITPPAPAAPGWRRAGPGDVAAVRAVHEQVHMTARHCGPLSWDDDTIRGWLADDDLFCYLTGDGFAAYRWADEGREIFVYHAVAGSADTTRALWALVGSSSSIAQTVRARVSPAEPFGLMIAEPDLSLSSGPHREWMLRVVDAQAAVAGRGFPAGLEVTVPVRLEDTARPRNRGDWTLAVSNGKGSIERSQTAAADPLILGARGFAALYAGTTVPVLRRAGLASGGDPESDALLDAAFTAQPFCLDTF
jgi:predicted acetyltransferase